MTEVIPTSANACRICGATAAREVGMVEFHQGYEWPIYDCNACGCRFTRHENAVYDHLHSEVNSSYTRYRVLQETCERLFRASDLAGLRASLAEMPKYRLVVNEVDRLPQAARILEIGSSRGYLTAYSILTGRTVIGVDVSAAACAAATHSFGGCFVPPGAPEIENTAPYDLIYHVGTIGCVADPLGMTQQLLTLLKPGGVLVFNAPNLAGCCLRGQLWIDSAPPPDVVTLFAPGFWRRQMSELAFVEEHEDAFSPEDSLRIGLRKLFRLKWRTPVPLPLAESRQIPRPAASLVQQAWLLFERMVAKCVCSTGLLRWVPPQPHEFGLFVKMTRRAATENLFVSGYSASKTRPKIAILSQPGYRVTAQILKCFQRAGWPVAMVIIETAVRTKYGAVERDFHAAHACFDDWLQVRHSKNQKCYLWCKTLLRRLARILNRVLSSTVTDELEHTCVACDAAYIRVERHSSAQTRAILEQHGIDIVLLGCSGWLIKEPLLSMPGTQIINVHIAKLPEHRSLDSLPWSVMAGDSLGVTTHLIDAGVDTGPVLLHQPVQAQPGDNLSTLRERLDRRIPDVLLRTVQGLAEGSIRPREQQLNEGTHHRPMTFEELCEAEQRLQEHLNGRGFATSRLQQ